ncbi:unnamed protein product [Brassica rapa subsp. trilocularis]
MAQRYRMWLPKSKLLTRNMKGEKAEAHTSLRIYNEAGEFKTALLCRPSSILTSVLL